MRTPSSSSKPMICNYSIRPARPDEAEALSSLALRSKAYWGYSPSFMAACRDELTYTAEQIRDRRFRFAIAEAGAVRVGFYALYRSSADDAELEALFVEPAHIGGGCGRALMDDAKRSARSWGASRLVIQGDPHAEPFYRAAGAVLSGRRESESIPGRTLPLFVVECGSNAEPNEG